MFFLLLSLSYASFFSQIFLFLILILFLFVLFSWQDKRGTVVASDLSKT